MPLNQVVEDQTLEVVLGLRGARWPAQRLVAADNGQVEKRCQLTRHLAVLGEAQEFLLEQMEAHLIHFHQHLCHTGVASTQTAQGEFEAHVFPVGPGVGQRGVQQPFQIGPRIGRGLRLQDAVEFNLALAPTCQQRCDQIGVICEVPVKAAARHTQRVRQQEHARLVKTAFHHRPEGSIEPVVTRQAYCFGTLFGFWRRFH